MTARIQDRPSVYALLRDLISEGRTPEQAADIVLRRAAKDVLAEMVRPIVVSAASRYARDAVRAVEQEVDRRIADGEDPISVRRKLNESGFLLPSGERVLWLDATAEQHRARAGWACRQSQSLGELASRHEAAAVAIELAGVTCLRDLETVEGAA